MPINDSGNEPLNIIHGTAALKRVCRRARLANAIVEILSHPGCGKTEMVQSYHDWADDVIPPDITEAEIEEQCKIEGIHPDDFLSTRMVHTMQQGDMEDSDWNIPWPSDSSFTYLLNPMLADLRMGDIFHHDECTLPFGAKSSMLKLEQGTRISFMGWTGPKGILRIRTGNLAEDGNYGYQKSPVLGNRVCQYVWFPRRQDWLADYALVRGVDPIIAAAVQIEGDDVFLNYDAARDRNSTPRSLTLASNMMTLAARDMGQALSDADRLEILAGYLPDEVTLKIQALFALHDKLVPFKHIVQSPDTAPIPDNPAARFMTVANVARRTCKDTFDKVMGWTLRLPLEEQGAVVEPIVKRLPILESTHEYQAYSLRVAPLAA